MLRDEKSSLLKTSGGSVGDYCNCAVIIAVVAVRVMQVAVDNVVGVVAVRHSGVPASIVVNVAGGLFT